MKTRSFLYLFMVVLLSTAVACVNNQQQSETTAQDPGEFLKEFFEVWNEGDIDKSMTMIYQTADMSAEEKARLKKGLQIGYQELQDENGGIENISILHQETSEDGNEVMVSYLVEYVNGGSKEVTRKIVKHKGKWMLSL